jgi:hypothetical protein
LSAPLTPAYNLNNFVSRRSTSALVDGCPIAVKGGLQELPNDFVWIFAGGTPPYDFLKKIGIRFGTRDMTLEANREVSAADFA